MIPANASARKGPEGKYPLHYLVWHNRHRELEKEVRAGQVDIEQLDPRGRTPLHLATTLGHLECARVLLAHGADVGRENRSGWTVLQEAVSTRDLELVQLVLRYRDYQRVVKRLAGIPMLLEKLRKAQDFYVEMKWEFTSWVPLVSKICPSDTYKVWKSGQNLRVDTTLLGFDHMTWQRGNRSFVFRGQDTSAVVMEIDHDRRVVYMETLALAGQDRELLLAAAQPSEEQVLSRLTAPVVTTQLDTKNISFERNKTGILGWRSEKTEMVNGYEAKVYGASNVELITRTRTEHLSEQHKGKVKGCKTPLQSFLGIAEQHGGPQNGTLITQTLSQANPPAITAEEYFNPNFELGNRAMGRPMELTTKTQNFPYPLGSGGPGSRPSCGCVRSTPCPCVSRWLPSLTSWLSATHFLPSSGTSSRCACLLASQSRLKSRFFTSSTPASPSGTSMAAMSQCPRCEVAPAARRPPLAVTLPASAAPALPVRLSTPQSPTLPKLGSISPPDTKGRAQPTPDPWPTPPASCRACEISPALFEAPRGYSVLGGQREAVPRDEDDDLLRFAIQQSLLEAGSEYDQVTIWEALTNSKPGTHPMSYEGRRQDSDTGTLLGPENPQCLQHLVSRTRYQDGFCQPPFLAQGGWPVLQACAEIRDLAPWTFRPSTTDRSAPPTPQRQPMPPAPVPSPRPSPGPGSSSHVFRSYDEQLRLAMELSAQEQEERRRRVRQEEEELERILRLSLTEQ
ncbi:ankyrin repeat domain-containing protein 13B isoform X7 [Mus musculus]|uniref:ankyrin repeat domain-containing protein 13B isoform X7 n=1 Tax=Mus musculus TaxID=10090 RepID=UPI0005ABAD7B|nr:ankyrin repeat domain-containing protein 13B isoform X7 [Mus musculus]|eukprot:XP_011247343.1 PREDICTED: ankyrin repeat domain-containing protein 13B isoform X7 [Mus musculus]